ncbi:MAG: N-acetylmuramoyl-L-alanine amidase, partial [Armatimonadetes bacterium]|nr:N-acetylmuramoyl-L-alanine amidase [Armatimonadota bacterium]
KPAPKQDPAMGSGQRVGNPILDEEGKATNLKFPLEGIPGPAASFRALSLLKFQILVPGANRMPGEIKLDSRLIEEITVDRDPVNNLILLITLKRPATVQFTSKPQGIILSFTQPAKSDGTLLGKTICLDAGHGGKDSGTGSVKHGTFEKNLTLPTTLMLAKKLTDAGANVVLCRNDDSYPSLTERAAIANRNNADVFVSIHYNSNSVANTASGIMVFYHGKSELGKLLAECINTRIKMKGLLPDRGVKSDLTIAKNSGFSVLRNTTMTGVLCELGFLSHSHDLSVVKTTEFRESVTDALVEGLRAYFGDTKDLETK